MEQLQHRSGQHVISDVLFAVALPADTDSPAGWSAHVHYWFYPSPSEVDAAVTRHGRRSLERQHRVHTWARLLVWSVLGVVGLNVGVECYQHQPYGYGWSFIAALLGCGLLLGVGYGLTFALNLHQRHIPRRYALARAASGRRAHLLFSAGTHTYVYRVAVAAALLGDRLYEALGRGAGTRVPLAKLVEAGVALEKVTAVIEQCHQLDEREFHAQVLYGQPALYAHDPSDEFIAGLLELADSVDRLEASCSP